jgi:hydroxymethylpyrimidine/phosphomethylpyrimidine kinase
LPSVSRSRTRAAVLVIAGVDSSGGAGLTRDVESIRECGGIVLCAVTAVTAQTDRRVSAVHVVPPRLVRAQIAAALATRRIGAVKIGMLATRATVAAVLASLARVHVPLVLDPVLAASSGGRLIDAAGERLLRRALLPRATLLTPNIPEAAALLEVPLARSDAELLAQAHALCRLGPAAVLLKGGHGSGPQAVDLLVTAAGAVHRLSAARLPAMQRGTGCALAAAIAAGLAARLSLRAACEQAKRHVSELLQRA